MLRMDVVRGRTRRLCGVEVTWWGLSQAHKWRWHGTHIDLGPVSVYGLPRSGPGAWAWRAVSVAAKPLRLWYHWRYCREPRM